MLLKKHTQRITVALYIRHLRSYITLKTSEIIYLLMSCFAFQFNGVSEYVLIAGAAVYENINYVSIKRAVFIWPNLLTVHGYMTFVTLMFSRKFWYIIII